ncbi:MAG: NACHT domain-containing protein [Leptolyngbyaceae cyanobacterium bins.302]|nr:NACHT domain-containing protein [Leptolyngbyaceae cyanobacterium bins.302]
MNADEALRFIEELIHSSGEKPLSDLQRSIFRGAWTGKDYKEIHRDCGQVGLDHIMRNVGPRLWKRLSRLVSDRLGEPIEVRKEVLQGPIERLYNLLLPQNSVPFEPEVLPEPFLEPPPAADNFDDFWNSRSLNRKQDWGQAPDTSLFQGRLQELHTLYQWVEEDGCRLIALVGTAGSGKTDLSVKLTERLRDRFELVLWRSLDSALTGYAPPLLPTLLAELTQFLTDTATTPDLAGFIDCIRRQRCLIVLDGFEAVLQSKVLSGEYQPGYENYSDLLKRVSDTSHLSCVLLTSREKPREIEARDGEKAPVRSHQVPGLEPDDVQNLFFAKGTFLSTEQDWRSLTHQYEGNPRFLQQVATTISSAFGRDVSRFLTYQQDKAIFVGDIRRSLDQQLGRLSYAEVTLIRELARHREPATLEEIQQLVKASMSSDHLLEVLLSLVRRSLLKSSSISYALAPLITEFMAEN